MSSDYSSKLIRRSSTTIGRCQSTQTQAANSWGQDSIVTSSLSYSESLRNQRQQTKNTTLALKKLKYQFKNISSKILRSKTSQAAKQAAGQARREIMRLKRQKQNSDSDSDSEVFPFYRSLPCLRYPFCPPFYA